MSEGVAEVVDHQQRLLAGFAAGGVTAHVIRRAAQVLVDGLVVAVLDEDRQQLQGIELGPGGAALRFVDDVQLPAVQRAVSLCMSNLGWLSKDEGSEGEHEWVVLRTGSHDAFLRPFDQFVDFGP